MLTASFNNTPFGSYTFRELADVAMNQALGRIPAVNLPDAVDATLTSIQDLWNLDRSEAARRVYIDAWITSGMEAARNGIAIITLEENLQFNAALPGHGRIDYLICEMVGNPVRPEYAPSVIIEAKLDLGQNAFSGTGQLVAELETMRQFVAYGDNPLRGIVTDGRRWRFIELLPIYKDIIMTPLYDTGMPGNWNQRDCRRVWGRLCQFLSQMRSHHVLMQ